MIHPRHLVLLICFGLAVQERSRVLATRSIITNSEVLAGHERPADIGRFTEVLALADAQNHKVSGPIADEASHAFSEVEDGTDKDEQTASNRAVKTPSHEENAPSQDLTREDIGGEGLVPCDGATLPRRSRSPWCEANELDAHISFQPIRRGQGLCLDGQCYAMNSLRQWLKRASVLPHNRARFTIAMLDAFKPQLQRLATLTTDSPVSSLAFVPRSQTELPIGDDQAILIGTSNGVARLWNIEWGYVLKRYDGHAMRISAVHVNSNGSTVLTASYDRTIRLWDAREGIESRRLIGHSSPVTCALFSPNDRLIVSGSTDRTVRVWDAGNGAEVRQLSTTFAVLCIAFKPFSNDEVAAGYMHGSVSSWNINTGIELMKLHAHSDDINTISYSPFGTKLLLGSDDEQASIWDADTGQLVLRTMENAGAVFSAFFSRDGKKFVTSSQESVSMVWNATTGKQMHRLINTKKYMGGNTIALSPEGNITAVTAGESIYLFEVSL